MWSQPRRSATSSHPRCPGMDWYELLRRLVLVRVTGVVVVVVHFVVTTTARVATAARPSHPQILQKLSLSSPFVKMSARLVLLSTYSMSVSASASAPPTEHEGFLHTEHFQPKTPQKLNPPCAPVKN